MCYFLFSYRYVYKIIQERKWVPKAGWASSNAERRRCLAAPSLLKKAKWAIDHPAHPPVTILGMNLILEIKVLQYKVEKIS